MHHQALLAPAKAAEQPEASNAEGPCDGRARDRDDEQRDQGSRQIREHTHERRRECLHDGVNQPQHNVQNSQANSPAAILPPVAAP